jgi:hypothetical protein
MKFFNYSFYFIFFIGFFLPTNSSFYLPLPGVLLKINEVAFLFLPIINLFCYSKNNVIIENRSVRRNILLLLSAVLFTEFVIKNIFYDQSIGEAVKSIRIGLPLFSSLILIYQGIRADIQIVWKTLLMAISVSVILSILSLFVDLPIYYDLESGTNILEELQGRVMNMNASFGVIGFYLLFEDKNKWYNQGWLIKITVVLSVISLLLTFNRTYLALLFLAGIYLIFRNFKIKQILKSLFFASVFLGLSFYLYKTNNVVQRQIDKRILPIILGEASLQESTIENQRSYIYEAIIEKIQDNNWFIGLPYKKPIYEDFSNKNDNLEHNKTDISFVNILLRYGILILLSYFIIFKQMYHKGYFVPSIFWIYFLASMNTDALMNQNSVFFLFFFSFILRASSNNKIFDEKYSCNYGYPTGYHNRAKEKGK